MTCKIFTILFVASFMLLGAGCTDYNQATDQGNASSVNSVNAPIVNSNSQANGLKDVLILPAHKVALSICSKQADIEFKQRWSEECATVGDNSDCKTLPTVIAEQLKEGLRQATLACYAVIDELYLPSFQASLRATK